MSDAFEPDDGPPTAAEYVLGVLDAAERRAFAARLEREPSLRAEVEGWEQRLAPLAGLASPMAPPAGLWTRIEGSLPAGRVSAAGGVARIWDRLAFWRWLSVGLGGLAAASLAGLAVVLTQPAPEPLVATLAAQGGSAQFVVTIDRGTDQLVITPVVAPGAEARARELWLVPPGGSPASLGVIDAGHSIRVRLPGRLGGEATSAAALAVSLEPRGGSPTGQPTGPVIAQGALQAL